MMVAASADAVISISRCHWHTPFRGQRFCRGMLHAFAEVCSTLAEVCSTFVEVPSLLAEVPSTLAEVPSLLAEVVSSLAVARCYSEHMVTSMRWFCFRSVCAICCTSWTVMLSTIWQ